MSAPMSMSMAAPVSAWPTPCNPDSAIRPPWQHPPCTLPTPINQGHALPDSVLSFPEMHRQVLHARLSCASPPPPPPLNVLKVQRDPFPPFRRPLILSTSAKNSFATGEEATGQTAKQR
mmetsp:Transcript_38088/g.90486  ORF Transcript_38088/g.90486 Transcript_38088/m.90486 type:complete len:119 (+) Transcript_38088:327-683(+)